MQKQRGSFSNSFSNCIGQQIQLYTSWSESRQQKITAIGNSTFRQEEYSSAGQVTIYFSRGGPTQQQSSLMDILPIHYFPLTVRKSKVLKPAHLHYFMARAEKTYSLSRRCQFQKIASFPSGGNNHKSPFQEDVPMTMK